MSEPCGAAYGHNPDSCYRPADHDGAHCNRWGTTWASDKQWQSRRKPTTEADQ